MPWLPDVPPSRGDDVKAYQDVVSNAPLRLPFAAGARIETPDQKRALAPADLGNHLASSPVEAISLAADGTLAFVEWQHGDLLGVALTCVTASSSG